MSTSSKRRDEGFTLVEVMVAMGLTAVVLVAALPALLSMLRSSVTVKKDTRAKNLTQERVEQLRDLRFHIDRQNGPFLDLLDIYYTNAKAAAPVTTLSVGGTTLTGQYVATGTPAAGEPSVPFYRTSVSNVNGAAGFSQVITAQFLGPDGSPVPAARFQDRYDSQTVGQDQAPTLLVGMTVITKWTDGTRAKSYRTYTRVTDGRSALPVIQTQAKAIAVDVTSTAADGTTLELQEGTASSDGAQSSGSTVSGFAAGALATRTGAATITGAQAQFNLPTSGVTATGATSPQAGSSCSWYGFGRTAVTNVTGDISTGLPKAPADVDSTTPSSTFGASVGDNSGGGCGLLSFDNTVGGGIARTSDALGFEMGSGPYVRIPDTASGSAAAVGGNAFVSSNVLTSIPQKSTAGASAFTKRKVVLFPNNPESGGQGLMSVTLDSASVTCASGSSTTDGTVVGKYNLTVGWWGRLASEATASWRTATWVYDSSASTPMVQTGAAWNPTGTFLGNGLRLSDVITTSIAGTSPATVNTGANTGLRGFTNGVLTLTTASTLTNELVAGYSAIKVQVGQLTCVADDQR